MGGLDSLCGLRVVQKNMHSTAIERGRSSSTGGGGGTRTPVRIWLIQGFYRLIPVWFWLDDNHRTGSHQAGSLLFHRRTTSISSDYSLVFEASSIHQATHDWETGNLMSGCQSQIVIGSCVVSTCGNVPADRTACFQGPASNPSKPNRPLHSEAYPWGGTECKDFISFLRLSLVKSPPDRPAGRC